jgi:hypothetical protein
MAKKKKRRPRTRPPSTSTSASESTTSPPPARGGANLERRDRKEEARRIREAERRRLRRASAFRRTFTMFGIAAGAIALVLVFQSLSGPNEIPEEAQQVAQAAGCTEVVQPASSAPSGQHLSPGQSHTYSDPPATSGIHDPSPITEPKVFETQAPETRAVHSLEHGAVFVYYLPEADGGVSQAVVDRLAQIANGDGATFLSPYPSLTPDRALTLTAWNRRQSCPATDEGGTALSPADAATIVEGLVTAFECTSNAPENGAAPC